MPDGAEEEHVSRQSYPDLNFRNRFQNSLPLGPSGYNSLAETLSASQETQLRVITNLDFANDIRCFKRVDLT
jgi:hypothetical protein